ncbi:hypothetical protein LCGC14_3041400 [marine sediment metagenome]|uniref:Uncharacterized protein n=1 Tax=marine sediment metagenome TaxID=412755 RepID=A0A0F8WPZ9_9ZZZZ
MARVKIEIEADDPLVDRMEMSAVSEETVAELIRAVIWVFSEAFMKDLKAHGEYGEFLCAVPGHRGAEVRALSGDGPRLAFTRAIEEMLEAAKKGEEDANAED